MGRTKLIPADNITATYDPGRQRLHLCAVGVVQEYTYDIAFSRATYMGGVKFDLQGYSGSLLGRDKPYECEQSFDIDLNARAISSGGVFVATANHPDGKEVEVYWMGLGTGEGKEIQQNELRGERFYIRQSTIVPRGGAVKMKYDNSYLTLVGADIDGDELVWKFNSTKSGNTKVVVTVDGGKSHYSRQITYHVRVFARDGGRRSIAVE